MKQTNFTESPIDHHIQRDVLQQLFKSAEPLSFSDLKPGDVDNSLFMYHMRKLTARGLIEKNRTGYQLTPDGARRINFVSTDTLKPDLYPRVLVSFIVLDETKTHVLLSHRISNAAGYVGAYVMPAGRMRYGIPLHESVQERAKDLFGTTVEVKALGSYETIVTSDDGYTHHTVSFVHQASLDQAHDLPAEEHYELQWVKLDDAMSGKYGEVVQKITQHYTKLHEFHQPTFTVSL